MRYITITISIRSNCHCEHDQQPQKESLLPITISIRSNCHCEFGPDRPAGLSRSAHNFNSFKLSLRDPATGVSPAPACSQFQFVQIVIASPLPLSRIPPPRSLTISIRSNCHCESPDAQRMQCKIKASQFQFVQIVIASRGVSLPRRDATSSQFQFVQIVIARMRGGRMSSMVFSHNFNSFKLSLRVASALVYLDPPMTHNFNSFKLSLRELDRLARNVAFLSSQFQFVQIVIASSKTSIR